MTEPIKISIDGVEMTAKPGQTVLQAAIDNNVYIPYLCYWPGMKPYGSCRMCAVEVEGGRGTPASCTLPVADGMVVTTATPEVRDLRHGILELLLSEHPHGCLTCHRIELCGPQDICLRHVSVVDRCVVCPKNERCELKDTVRFVGANMESPFTYNYRNLQVETGDPFYDRDYNLCIVCARCVRVCEEIRGDDAVAMIERSGTVLVGTSFGSSLLESGCEFCGACIDVCPVGALVESDHKWDKAVKTVKTTCPHCSVGCQVNLEVDSRGHVIRSVGDWDSSVSNGQLCYTGKFGNEFVNKPERIKVPMIKQHGELIEASWEEALGIIASRLPDYKGDTFSLLVSPRVTNEQAYMAGEFARKIMGSNNVDLSIDHRLDLVEPLGRLLGNMAATGTIAELEDTGCVLVVNSNMTEEHNVAAIPIKKGHKKGNKLIVIDTREVELTRYADLWLRPFPGTENSLIAGMLKVIFDEGLQDVDFLGSNSENLDGLTDSLSSYDLGSVAATTGVSADKIALGARYFASGNSAAVVYALDNIAARDRAPLTDSLINLAVVTGNIGKPNTGLFPLRPGANSQGALDVGCNPAYLPGQVAVEGSPGLTTPSMLEAMVAGNVKSAMVIGDSPLFNQEAIHALTHTEFLVVQDLFLNPLAQSADVVLPMTSFAEEQGTMTNIDRWVQSRRVVIEPPGDARPSTYTFAELAKHMGGTSLGDGDPISIFAEILDFVPSYRALKWVLLANDAFEFVQNSGLQSVWSLPDRISLADLAIPHPRVSGANKFLFAPGRVLAMPGEEIEIIRSNGKNSIRREDALEIHPDDAAALGVAPGEMIEVATQTHRIRGMARTTGTLRGVVSATVLFGELATALDSSNDYDRMLRIPGLHVLPVQVEKVPS